MSLKKSDLIVIFQKKPSVFAPIMEEDSSDTNGTLEYLFDKIEECPIGTVPIQRTLKEHLVRARSLLDDRKRPDPKRQAVRLLHL